MGPINYSIGGPDPSQMLLQGLGQGLQINQMQQARQAAEMQARQQQQMNAELEAASRDPRMIPGLMVRYPQLAEKFKVGLDAMNADQQRGALANNTEVAAAIASGQPEFAVQIVERQANLRREQGDNQAADELMRTAEKIKADPDAMLAFTLARIGQFDGGDKVAKGVLDLFEEKRKKDKAPFEQRAAEAGARTAEAGATTAEAGAAVAAERNANELLQQAAQLGLTKAQTNQAMALTRKTNNEISQAAILAASGDPAKKFDAETKLRSEFVKEVTPVVEVKQAYERVKASQDNAVGDLSLIFGYMKMLDPGSVVREGEFATAQNAAGVPQQIMNAYNRALTGQRLSPSQRSAFKGQAKDLFDVADRREADIRKRLDPVIKTYSLDSRNVYGEPQAAAPTPAPAPSPGAAPTVSGWGKPK